MEDTNESQRILIRKMINGASLSEDDKKTVEKFVVLADKLDETSKTRWNELFVRRLRKGLKQAYKSGFEKPDFVHFLEYAKEYDLYVIPEMLDTFTPLMNVKSHEELNYEELNTLNFDPFKYTVADLVNFASYTLKNHEIASKLGFSAEKLEETVSTIAETYQINPFHTFTHGFSVFQMTYYISLEARQTLQGLVQDSEYFLLLLATLGHDVNHPGVTNAFMTNVKDELAVTYNDTSILENHHCAEFFRIANKTQLFEHMPDAEYKEARKTIIECILATDMVKHNDLTANLRYRVKKYPFTETLDFEVKYPEKTVLDIDENDDRPLQLDNQKDRRLVLNCLCHSVDVGNQCFEFELSQKWSYLVSNEFHAQVLTEEKLGLPTSEFLRYKSPAALCGSQGYFGEVILLPLWVTIADLLPEVSHLAQNLINNKNKWKHLQEEKTQGK
mmetsp:Transcript_62271/g.71403  ORF Transcript_62271/g.71403 Transcript_62271/m.71403 type:complete len:445 (-) Transcript_62271:658-1992(-)